MQVLVISFRPRWIA